MSLAVEGDTVVCNHPDTPTTCTAPFVPGNEKAGQFAITVNASVIPQGGYSGFGTEVVFGGLAYNSTDCEDEVVWPDEGAGACLKSIGASGQAQLGAGTALIPPFPKSNFVGTLVRLEAHCPAVDTFEVVLTAYAPSAAFGATYIDTQATSVSVKVQGTRNLDLDGDGALDDDDPRGSGEFIDYSIADALVIACGGGATPTAGPSPTPCPAGPCPTATATLTPPVTVTPAPPTPTGAVPSGTLTPTLTGAPVVGTATPPPPSRVNAGDVSCDGSVDSTDAFFVLQLDAQLIEALPCAEAGNVNEDGVVNVLDAQLILQFDAGLIESLTPESASEGWAAAWPGWAALRGSTTAAAPGGGRGEQAVG